MDVLQSSSRLQKWILVAVQIETPSCSLRSTKLLSYVFLPFVVVIVMQTQRLTFPILSCFEAGFASL